MAIDAEYRQHLGARQAEVARLERSHARLSWLRLAAAGIAIATPLIGGLAMMPWVVIPVGVFIVTAVAHDRVLGRRAKATRAVVFYERGLERIAGEWTGKGHPGEQYRAADHPYASDLDIFGRGSLFELLATTRTRAGEESIAAMLLTPVEATVARARQDAVRELSGRLDLREAIAVMGDDIKLAIDAPLLRQWAASPLRLSGTALRWSLLALATATCALWIWWAETGALGLVAAGVTVAQSLVAWTLQARVRTVVASIDEPAHDLDVLAGLLGTLERETFASAHLVRLQQRLGRSGLASREVARLSRLVSILSSRRNVIFALPAALMLWATQWAFAIEAWRGRVGANIPEWLDIIGELEALLALGGFAAEHPAFVYPDLVAQGPLFEAEALAHPTLGPTAVPNDISLGAGGLRLVIVSGSNMSGKSTWMRTIGTSLVLASAGAPVRAARCRVSPMAIGAAMRVEDSLTDGKSRFFAEITRLKQIVDLTTVESGRVLFLLDEILAGTNSHDRRIGAEALLSGLVAAGAIGLVTTHDLALGEIAERLPNQSANAHFEDQFTNGLLHFDYRLKPGIVRTSNALALMRSIGLDVRD